MIAIEIVIRDQDKIVEIWLPKAERDDPAIEAKLKPLYKAYKAKKYTVAVFRSGDGDLRDSVLGLIQHNRQVIAKRELAAEKAALSMEPKPVMDGMHM